MEPWLTGTIKETHPLKAALLYSFEHARMDVDRWTEGLTPEQLARRTGDIASVSFHVRHLAGSIDRLLTYAEGRQLSEQQLRELKAEEADLEVPRDQLLASLTQSTRAAEQRVRNLDTADLDAVREVGRKRVPVLLGVLLAHIAEHTQRHVGAAIVTAKLVRLA